MRASAILLLILFMLPSAAARAACTGGLITSCPQAALPLSGNEVLWGYQNGNPVQIPTSAVAGAAIPSTILSLTINGTGTALSVPNGDTSLGGGLSVAGVASLSNTNVSGLLTASGGIHFAGASTGILSGAAASVNLDSGAASFGGTVNLGNASTNYFSASGSSASPILSVVGTGNLFGVVKGSGDFGGLFQTSNGNVLLTQDAGNGATGNYLKITADVAGSPVQIASADNTGGIRFTSPIGLNYNWIYSGTQSGIDNHPFSISSNVSGASSNTGQYGINQIFVNPSLQTAYPMLDFLVEDSQQAGFFGWDVPTLITMNQAGAPAVPPTWAPTTSYSPAAPIVFNGTNEYQLNSGSSCTSGSSGGPTGTGTSIADGGCNWRYVTDIEQSYYLTILASQANMSQNVGGTSAGYVGFVFGGNAVAAVSGGATYYNELVGWETDSFNTLASGNPFRQVIQQFVKTGNGAHQDWGISIDGLSQNAILLANATSANGIGIQFGDQSTGGLQTMAGAFDCILCSATGTNTASGYFVTGGGGFIVRGPSAQLLGSGDLQVGSAGFHIVSQGLTIDTTYEALASVGALSGGSHWTTGMLAADDYGNIATVTASAGVPTALSLTCGVAACPKTYVAAASLPGGAVTWHPINANGNFLDSAGAAVVPTSFTTASETYTAGTTLNIGTGSATAINIGNSGSTTAISGLMKLSRYTVATLPTCNSTSRDALAVVSDATSPTYNGALTGSGTSEIPVFCNGSSWTAH